MKKNGIDKVNIENDDDYEKWCKHLNVHLIGNHYNSLIDEHSKEMEKRRLHEKEKYKDYMSFQLQYKLKYSRFQGNIPVLNIEVSEKQRTRAYSFMDYFIEAIQAIGGSIRVDNHNNDNTVINFPYCTLECSLLETKCRYKDMKPAGVKTMKPSYDFVDSGELEFRIYSINKSKEKLHELIYKEDTISLKDQIIDIFIDLRAVLIEISNKNREAKRLEDEAYEESNRKWELQRQREEEEAEQKKLQDLRIKHQEVVQKHLEKWEHINEVESYLADIRLNAAKQPDDVKLIMKQYCDYVEMLFDKKAFIADIIEFTKDNF